MTTNKSLVMQVEVSLAAIEERRSSYVGKLEAGLVTRQSLPNASEKGSQH